jgi:hypothetical protein
VVVWQGGWGTASVAGSQQSKRGEVAEVEAVRGHLGRQRLAARLNDSVEEAGSCEDDDLRGGHARNRVTILFPLLDA